MVYTKPEIVVLGEAANVIQQLKLEQGIDGAEDSNPAYELDE